MSPFWEKLRDPNVPAMDLLWYFHSDFGDDCTFALADWCLTLISNTTRRDYAATLHLKQTNQHTPASILRVQNAWRALVSHQMSRAAFFDRLAKQRMELLASGAVSLDSTVHSDPPTC